MNIFLFACFVLFVVIAGFFYYLVKKRRKGFHFQARLTILLLLLTLVPAVPLILLSTELLKGSFEVLVAGYLEETLDSSIAAIRVQLTERNARLLGELESPSTNNDVIDWAKRSPVNYAFSAHRDNGSVRYDTLYLRGAEAAGQVKLEDDALDMILNDNLGHILYLEEAVFESYRIRPDSAILIVGFPVDSITINAINRIQQSSESYGLLRILREGLVQGDVVDVLGVILLAILTVMAIFVAYRLSKGINSPIRDLVHGFQEVGEDNLDVTVGTKAKDEFEYLLMSFNKMVAQLKHSRQRLVQSERLAAWRDVARQISHEIKNPLTPIQLSLHRLRNKIAVPEEHASAVEESFRTIDEEIESLRQIATEFSEFARLPKPRLAEANINDIIRSAAVLYEKNDRGIPILLNLDEKTPDSMLDQEQMKRVFINLIKNSLEASDNNSSPINISSQLEEKEHNKLPAIHIEVLDHGCGMGDETLRKIFDPYFTTKKDGTGLGMPIIKRIIEEHGGDISVRSESGAGTTIQIRLPVERES